MPQPQELQDFEIGHDRVVAAGRSGHETAKCRNAGSIAVGVGEELTLLFAVVSNGVLDHRLEDGDEVLLAYRSDGQQFLHEPPSVGVLSAPVLDLFSQVTLRASPIPRAALPRVLRSGSAHPRPIPLVLHLTAGCHARRRRGGDVRSDACIALWPGCPKAAPGGRVSACMSRLGQIRQHLGSLADVVTLLSAFGILSALSTLVALVAREVPEPYLVLLVAFTALGLAGPVWWSLARFRRRILGEDRAVALGAATSPSHSSKPVDAEAIVGGGTIQLRITSPGRGQCYAAVTAVEGPWGPGVPTPFPLAWFGSGGVHGYQGFDVGSSSVLNLCEYDAMGNILEKPRPRHVRTGVVRLIGQGDACHELWHQLARGDIRGVDALFRDRLYLTVDIDAVSVSLHDAPDIARKTQFKVAISFLNEPNRDAPLPAGHNLKVAVSVERIER